MPLKAAWPGPAGTHCQKGGTKRRYYPSEFAYFLVGDTGFEPVTSSVSGKRATAAPIAHI